VKIKELDDFISKLSVPLFRKEHGCVPYVCGTGILVTYQNFDFLITASYTACKYYCYGGNICQLLCVKHVAKAWM
jgi:hypothetical protein